MAKKKDRCRQMLAAAGAAVVVAFAYGCGGEESVDHGGSLVSEEGQIAFTRATKFMPPDFESEVYTINVDGSGEKRLTDSPGLDAFPAWSPDGEHIAFATGRDGNWELYVMDADGAEQRRLTNTPEDESSPAWSPDGEKIAYVTGVIDGNETIHVMNAEGSSRRRLAEGNWPSWSPDGEDRLHGLLRQRRRTTRRHERRRLRATQPRNFLASKAPCSWRCRRRTRMVSRWGEDRLHVRT